MSRRLVYRERAAAQLAEIAHFIAQRSGHVEIAEGYVARLRRRCEDIARLPVVWGRPRDELRPDLRSIPTESHVIYFRYVGDDVEVVAILHGARDVRTGRDLDR